MSAAIQLKGKTSTIHQVAFELRYSDGFVFLDKAGRTISAITRDYPEWIFKGGDVDGMSVVNLVNGCICTFSRERIAIRLENEMGSEASLGAEDILEFSRQVDLLTDLIVDHLGIKQFTRIGCRLWHLFPATSVDEVGRWVRSLGLISLNNSIQESFGGEIETSDFVIVIVGPEWKFRIGMTSIERFAHLDIGNEILNVKTSALSKNQKEVLLKQQRVKRQLKVNPRYSAQLDIDVSQENPIILNTSELIRTASEDVAKKLAGAMEA